MKILIFGSNGLVGKSLSNKLKNLNKLYNVIDSTRKDTNLFKLNQVRKSIEITKPDIVINCAAKVGGILANNIQRTNFLLENLKIGINITEALIPHPNIKLINLGSSCIYPLNAENPIKEDYFMTGKLEETNSPYAIAKISSIEMSRALNFQYGHKVLNLMPTNLYGPNDNFSEIDSHVIPGLISRMHKAKINNENIFQIWGTGKPLREFLHVDDLSSAIEFLMMKDIDTDLINIGSNEEISIYELGKLIKKIINFKGEIVFDNSKPDGNPRKLLDSSKVFSLGWKPQINLEEGLKSTYDWYLKNTEKIRN